MFGYVRAYIPELKVREYELYHSGYCGVCRAMGKCTGCLSRLTLTWDSVFLFFLRTALSDEPFELKKKWCPAHPFRKRVCVVSSPELDYAAKATAVLTYYKLKDDISDERGLKRFIARLAMPEARYAKKRAELTELCDACGRYLPALAEAERKNAPSFDEPAELSAKLTAELFACGFPENSPERILAAQIGYHTGKFIYAADAADDFSGDIKHKRYNPYAAMLGTDELSEEHKKMILDALRCERDEIVKALDLIDFDGKEGIKSILYNVAICGMSRQAEEILKKGTKHS